MNIAYSKKSSSLREYSVLSCNMSNNESLITAGFGVRQVGYPLSNKITCVHWLQVV